MQWKPNVTVAAVIEHDGRYLLVEENTPDGVRFNQPAGHLEQGESLLDAVVRETLEETAHHFRPTALLGVYRWKVPDKDLTYLRFAFRGEVLGIEQGRPLDEGIIGAQWMDIESIRAADDRHRSPLVWQCIVDHRAGKSYPLDLLTDYPDH